MNKLGMYKKLSFEDRSNITIYGIYNSIYEIARNNNIVLSDDVVIDIQKLSYDLWLDDEYYNLSENKIADFITECYIKDNEFLMKADDIDYNVILEAIDDNDYDFYKIYNDLER